MATLTEDITIEAAPSAVWQALSDHEGYVKWAGVDRMEVLSDGRELGAKRRATIGRMVLEQTVEAFEPERRFQYVVRNAGPFSQASSLWTLEEQDATTRVRLVSEFKLRLGLPGFLLGWRVRRGQHTALSGLKRYVESELEA